MSSLAFCKRFVFPALHTFKLGGLQVVLCHGWVAYLGRWFSTQEALIHKPHDVLILICDHNVVHQSGSERQRAYRKNNS